ncbi:hypothetical protein K9M59_01150 [Candidatus Gracilibacteria bacterium]|nr:hypothetical protein [Candidatus Gracilibacteria bacterium]
MELPYLPKGREILYVGEDNEFMRTAKQAAHELSLDPEHPTGAVVVREGQILGRGANGSRYHQEHGCQRKKNGSPTGQDYDLCPGCDPANHAERRALDDARSHGHDLSGADVYLWGHWWACQWCWEAMIQSGIEDLYLVRGAAEKFAKGNGNK